MSGTENTMDTSHVRSLHWVLKIGSLKKSLYFFERVFGLRILRHEEFESGCEATCNGPYGGAWSKTMIGYGPEVSNFALELTYNYGIDNYEFGNDLQFIAIRHNSAVENARLAGFLVDTTPEGIPIIHGPDNYKYLILLKQDESQESFAAIGLLVQDISIARGYYCGTLGMQEHPLVTGHTTGESITVGYSHEQTKLQFIQIQNHQSVNHASANGRIAFACRSVAPVFERITAHGFKVQTPPLRLPTPGKADVIVTILVDPDGYEICFVEDEAFYELANPTYNAVDWSLRRSKGGDGAPPPKGEKIQHGASLKSVETLEEIREILTSAPADKAVVLDFGASWCKKCKKIAPFVENQAAKFADLATFVAIDISVAEEVALEYGVTAVPRFFFFKNGAKVDEYIGSTESELRAKLQFNLDASEANVRRALHWVLKIGNLNQSMRFFENVLGLQVLRHEEFESGCEATCNGPYAGAWSKTMIGYGPEERNFALELTYNYGIDSYEFGNDLQYLAVSLAGAKERALQLGYSVEDQGSSHLIHGPDNYNYKIISPIPGRTEPWAAVGLRVADLARAKDYWCTLLGTQELPTPQGLETTHPSITIGFSQEQTMLQLIQINDQQPVNHAKSGGRIAFACPSVTPIFDRVRGNGDVVQTPPLTLPTPGKADVVVTILVDRDGYEICFVEDEAFYELATPTYDVIDFVARASRGGDGHPPPRVTLDNHSAAISSISSAEELAAVTTGTQKTVVVEFGAGWCKNCKRLAPFVENLANQLTDKLQVYSVDVQDAEELALELSVSSVPFFLVYQGGSKVAEYLGSSEAEVEKLIRTFLPEDASTKRSLHWVLKIGNLKESLRFFELILGLRVLRHEEFESGCEATCNGPYGGAWSKTMIGYGPERSRFALELTYNYGIDAYEFGNDLQYIAISNPSVFERATALGFQVDKELQLIQGPDNYKYKVVPEIAGRAEQFIAVALRVSNLQNAKDYWCTLLGTQELPTPQGLETTHPSITIGFSQEQTMLQLIQINDQQPVNHAKSGGRIAFACPSVTPIFDRVRGNGDVVQTPPLTLPTPGKADVVVTILVDRDGYEICFVEDEAFYELATPTYDVIDFVARASRGGDGHPPPRYT